MRLFRRDAVTRHEAVTGLAVLGLFVMSYLIWLHYSPDHSALCDLSIDFSCDIVNKSVYSAILDIPISVLGLTYFLLVLLLPHIKEAKRPFSAIVQLTILTLPLAIMLSGIELFVLGTICLLCEFSKVLMLGILALSYKEAHSRGERLDANRVLLLVIAGSIAAYAFYRLAA